VDDDYDIDDDDYDNNNSKGDDEIRSTNYLTILPTYLKPRDGFSFMAYDANDIPKPVKTAS